jgi:hypothetical protein
MKLSDTEFVRSWLEQFAQGERVTAAQLADAIMLVSRDALYQGLYELLDSLRVELSGSDEPVALYAEREVERVDGEIQPFFPGTQHGRATGSGVPPIVVDLRDQEVGSEGAIANFITSYERLHRGVVLNHPGPDRLRQAQTRTIVIVTDFIGSGKRIWEMIEAFWQVATIRSWRSYGLIGFAVVAYSGTDSGLAYVRSHRLRPDVRIVRACPTVANSFRGDEARAVDALCLKYPERHRYPFGFRGGGALIAFAHGIPNNSPAIFHSHKNGWRPLFLNRSALAAAADFPVNSLDELSDRAEAMLRIHAAREHLEDPQTRRWIKTMLVLAALTVGNKGAGGVSAFTRLPLAEVEELLGFTRIAGWTSATGALTPLGERELIRLRARRRRTIVLPTAEEPFYYPTQLRAR